VAKIEEVVDEKKSEESVTSTENPEVPMITSPTLSADKLENMEVDMVQEVVKSETQKNEEHVELEPPIQPIIKVVMETEAASRRGSQESAITSTTTTSTTRSSSTSSDSSTDSSDSDSSSDDENIFVDADQIKNIFKMCVKNLEECVSRFPEHYKSIFRLVHHFLSEKDGVEKSRKLLLTTEYKTGLGNSIQGLFSERKNNNFFNGVWRIPSQEIDRPGNFTAHLTKCISILMDVLKQTNDFETLLDLALQLQRNPEAEKKYLYDADRKELFQQAITCCVQAFRNKLRDVLSAISDGKKTDRDLLGLMLDIFKAHRKTLKIFQQKEQSLFSSVLVDVYKEYIKDKMILPESANLTDLAFKMCHQEINYRKNLEKGIITPNPHPIVPIQQNSQPQTQASSSPAPILTSQSLVHQTVYRIHQTHKVHRLNRASNSSNRKQRHQAQVQEQNREQVVLTKLPLNYRQCTNQ
jgi:calcineurin-binding protein cabin-1